MAIVARFHEKWSLFNQNAVSCFSSFNCRCVGMSGKYKPRGQSVWVLLSLTEQNKHLTGHWTRKITAHSIHGKLIYFSAKEQPFEWVSYPTGKHQLPMTLEWIHDLCFEDVKQRACFSVLVTDDGSSLPSGSSCLSKPSLSQRNNVSSDWSG